MSGSESIRLIEYAQASGPITVNREEGWFGPVKLLGWKSANGYDYLPNGVPASIYEGRPVNLNHHSESNKQRDVRDVFGWLDGPEHRPDGIWAKRVRVLNPKSESAENVFRAAEHKPDLFGFSHVADGKKKTMPTGVVIESVERVESVDLVVGPATTKGLNESKTMTIKLREALASAWKDTPAKISLLREMEGEPMMAAEVPTEMAADPDAALKAGFKAAIHAVVDDDSLDMGAKLAKIKEILKAQEKLMGGGEAPAETPAEEPADDDAAAEESKKRAAEMKQIQERFELRIKARDLCAEARITPNKVLLKALDAATTEAEIRELIEESKKAAVQTSVRSAAPNYTQTNGTGKEDKLPETLEEWRKATR